MTIMLVASNADDDSNMCYKIEFVEVLQIK